MLHGVLHHGPAQDSSTLIGTHSYPLVAISIVIAVVAAYSALELATRVKAATNQKIRCLWTCGGALSLGFGIWSMHFTGMLAFQIETPIFYHVPTVVISLVAAVLGSALALLCVTRHSMTTREAGVGAAATGLAISIMHYTGMASIRAAATQHYIAWLVVASVVVAIVVSFAALWIMFHFRDQGHGFTVSKAVAAVFMGAAIPTMHYIAMAAVSFSRVDSAPDLTFAIGISRLGKYALLFSPAVVTGFALLTTYTDKLAYQAGHDFLTGLVNRLFMEDRLQQALHSADRRQAGIAVFAIDLDGFKIINDAAGHAAGDGVLKEIAKRLSHIVRAADTVARIGGDEFLIILTDLNDLQDCIPVAQKCLQVMREPIAIRDSTYTVSGSIGISRYPADCLDPTTLLQCADAALYAAKRSGKNRYQIFSCTINSGVESRVEIASALKRALTDNELALHYQPQFRRDGTLFGFEALLRWTNSKLGTVAPSTFIPIAEDMGLIMPLGEWVLKTACVQVCEWRRAGFNDVRVSVNVSALEFDREDFVEKTMSILDEAQVPGSSIQLELTESIVLNNTDRAVVKLQKLRELGVTCLIDDFGTGYSGLKYLQELPLDGIKIDRTFVQRAVSHCDRHGGAIVKMIVLLADNMGLLAIAEGVETQSQMDLLIDAGCQLMQGFLLGRPMPAHAAEELLSVSCPVSR
jgi:diguanylate cyclase